MNTNIMNSSIIADTAGGTGKVTITGNQFTFNAVELQNCIKVIAKNINISNNILEECVPSSGAGSRYGINVDADSDVQGRAVIQGNTLTSNNDQSSGVFAGINYKAAGTISGNTLELYTANAVCILTATTATIDHAVTTITGNTVTGKAGGSQPNLGISIFNHNTVITGNNISHCAATGIDLNEKNECTVTGNFVDGTDDTAIGIDAEGSSWSTITGNTLLGDDGPGNTGLYLSTAVDCCVSGNLVRGWTTQISTNTTCGVGTGDPYSMDHNWTE